MPAKPNVLLISVDHWPGSLLGAAGQPSILTPTIDQLAYNGVRFTQAYSECPMCIPARRTLMTGTTSQTHGDRVFDEHLPMRPDLPTLAQTFRDAGYQAYAVGKLHVYPQRDRIGFDDVILNEEGRLHLGAVADDYELFLGDRGYVGQHFYHGMSSNEYVTRPWHLPEEVHVTNWTTHQMARTIKRRDPTRPAFWFLSYSDPHPPIVPPQAYLDMYQDVEIPPPVVGGWATDFDALPHLLKDRRGRWPTLTEHQIMRARRAFFASCTHIDHQLRLVIGTLREEGLLDDTIILFTSDHGDMLGNHGEWAKSLFYEDSTKVPMILVGVAGDERAGHHRTDDRLVGWQDVMPTLLDLAGIAVPDTVEGTSMVGTQRREWLYGECHEGSRSTRMVREGQYKLIYYAVGNHTQLFDLQEDPNELRDLSRSPEYEETLERLTQRMVGKLYGSDEDWLHEGRLQGLPDPGYEPQPNRGLSGQRGTHWPMPTPGYVSHIPG